MAHTWYGSHWIRPQRRYALYERDNWACVYCGLRVHPRNLHEAARALSLDHIIPRAAGGGNESDNLVTACRQCNRRKSAQPLWVAAPATTIIMVHVQRCLPPCSAVGKHIYLSRHARTR